MKKLKLFCIATLLTGVFSMLVGLTACTPSSPQDFLGENPSGEINYCISHYNIKIHTYNLGYINTFGNYKISQVKELNDLLENEILPNIRHEDNLNQIAINKLKEYDDHYFLDKSLILLIYGRGDTRFYSVKKFDIKDTSINITLSSPKLPEDAITIWHPQYYFYIFEIDKEHIAAVTRINVEYIEE